MSKLIVVVIGACLAAAQSACGEQLHQATCSCIIAATFEQRRVPGERRS